MSICPLKGENYATWRIQCKMALLKDKLWCTVTGEETEPNGEDRELLTKYEGRRDKEER